MIGHLHYLCQNKPERVQYLGRGKSLPQNCGQDHVTPELYQQPKYHRELSTIALPPPAERFGTVPESWLVGITTAPREQPTLEKCVQSIQKAGWENIHVFSEPGVANPLGHPEVVWHPNEEKLGPWRNFAAMIDFFARETEADAYLLCQDDALFFDGPVREFLERHVLWIMDQPHVLSLYTSSMYLKTRADVARGPGWHTLGRGGRFGWWGAVAFVLSREGLLDFHRSDVFQGWLTRRKSWLERDPATIAQIDTAVGFWAPTRGGLWTCLPSLVQHVGDTSTIYKSNRATGRRMAQWMLGGPPPHIPPSFWEKAASATISVSRWAVGGFQVAEKQLRKERMALCRQCDKFDPRTAQCGLCGCYVEAKTMLPHERCPDDPPKWRAVGQIPEGYQPTPCGSCGNK